MQPLRGAARGAASAAPLGRSTAGAQRTAAQRTAAERTAAQRSAATAQRTAAQRSTAAQRRYRYYTCLRVESPRQGVNVTCVETVRGRLLTESARKASSLALNISRP